MADSKKLGPLSPEILKLTDKLAKDPKSKLFVPLAEEYIKSGMLDEAVMVLKDGLKVHPHFSIARGTLGKAYLEMGQIREAKSEFEQAITTSPDNLLAHRKLAHIYKDEGRWKEALSSCQAILYVSPKDAEMIALRNEIVRLSDQGKISPKDHPLSGDEPVVGVPPAVGSRGPEETEQTVLTTLVAKIPMGPSSGPAELTETTGPSSHTLPAHAETPVSPPPGTAPAKDRMAEEIATESLADLYVKQGYYDKGIEIYRRLLEKDPGNVALKRKCDETEILIGIARKTPSAVPFSDGEESTSPVGKPTETAGNPSRRVSPLADSPDEKIRRLEAWLESIRKGQES